MTLENTAPAAAPEATPMPAAAPELASQEVEARSSGFEDLTPEELAYFNSRGTETTGLGVAPEPAAPTVIPYRAPVTPDSAPIAPIPAALAPAPAPQPAAQPPAAAPAQPEMATEPVTLDEIVVDAEGRMRNGKGQYVPHAALHEARERAKAERGRADSLEGQIKVLEGRFQQLLATAQPQPAPAVAPEPVAPPVVEDPEPDIDTDLFGYVKWQKRQVENLKSQLAETAKTATQRVEEVRGAMTEQQMLSSYRNDAQQFVAAKPEFAGAYRHLIDSRHAELALMGFDKPEERSAMIHREEREIVQQAYKLGKRPAEFLYNIAMSRGFRASPSTAPVVGAAPAPAPAPVAPVTPPAATPTYAPPAATPAAINQAAVALQNAAAAQAAAATLSGAGGASGDGLTAEAIANMSDADFMAFSQKMGKSGMRAVLGGRG